MRESVKQEALINEYKGNLFEFLLAQKTAQHFGLEAQFLTDLLPAFKDKLQFYDREVRNLDPSLAKNLPLMAGKTFTTLIEKLSFKPTQVFLVGKIAKSSVNDLDATDILLMNEKNETFGLSVKLGKAQSYINTKSGGVRTFLSEYFPHKEAEKFQQEFNQHLDQAYYTFANSLYQTEDLGTFDDFKRWRNEGRTELPGELEGTHRDILYKYYNQAIVSLYDKIVALQKINPSYFQLSMLRLLGFSDKPMLQVTAYHNDHELVGVKLLDRAEIASLDFVFKESKDELSTSSFHLNTDLFTMQIRMKPMNVFTTPSMKINCSVKYKN